MRMPALPEIKVTEKKEKGFSMKKFFRNTLKTINKKRSFVRVPPRK